MKSPETKSAALKMIAEGAYPRDVAAKMGLSTTTVRKWCIAAGVQYKVQKRGRRKGQMQNPIGIRKEAASLVAAGVTAREAGRRMRMSEYTVRNACREFGVKIPNGSKGRPSPNRRPDWDKVDWNKTDVELAKELNVSRQRANKQRHSSCGTATR